MVNFRKPARRYATLFTVLILAVIVVSYSFCNRENKDQVVVQLITHTLSLTHFNPLDIDDSFSEKVFKLYLKRIDSNKRFFTKEDIQKLEPYKNQIDDEIKSKSMDFYNLANDMLSKNTDKVQGYYTEILSKPFTFEGTETVETDPDKTEFAKDDASLKDAWQKALKYQVMVQVADMMENQEKLTSDTIPRKSFAEMEADARKKVLKLHSEWFKHLKSASETERLAIFVNAITSVYDPHTQYLAPNDKENFDMLMTGQLEGIGAQLQENDGYVKVVDIVPGSPSWLQGELKVGDVIMKVKQEKEEPVDIFNMQIGDVVKLIRGKKGTKVTLSVKKVNGVSKNITITRDLVIMKETYAKSAIIENAGGKIGYIFLPKFYANFEQTETGHSCAEDVSKEIDKLKKENVKGIILDLRNNGGGSLGDAVRMGGLFINKGPIVQVKPKNGNAKVLEDTDPLVHYSGNLIVMVNSLSASASEILAAAMQDYHRAIIMGSPTFGKGTVQTVIDLDENVSGTFSNLKPFGSMLVTIQKFYRINGGATQLKGVTPDVILPDPYSELDLGEREQEYCMPWNKISPANYETWTGFPKFDQVVQKENTQVASDSDFKVIKEQALEIKKQKNQTIISLNLEKYKKQDEELKAKSKSFEAIMKKPTGLKVAALPVDIAETKGDTVILARTNKWIKDLSKDIYLKQAVKTLDLSNEIK